MPDYGPPPSTQQPQAPAQDKGEGYEHDELEESRQAYIVEWSRKIREARDGYKEDFDRMRENSKFAGSIQWKGQKKMTTTKYIANLVNKAVNGKVALLYARDPKAVARIRKRRFYKVWDEDPKSVGVAIQRQTLAEMGHLPPDPEAQAVINDYQQGHLLKQQIKNVCDTLEKLYQYEIDIQEPDFKTQMKQCVRRVVTCGVGYVSLSFERTGEQTFSTTQPQASLIDRGKKLAVLHEKLEKNPDPASSTGEQAKLVTESIQESVVHPNPESDALTERIVIDFPKATSIIPDPACTALKGFVGAHWIVHEMILPKKFVAEWFECPDLCKPDAGKGTPETYGKDGPDQQTEKADPQQKDSTNQKCCLWRLINMDTKSQCYLVDGYKDYVSEPEPVEPGIRGFWPIRALTFNEIETDDTKTASIFPPSDVQLMTAPQREWNRMREALRKHRAAKAPCHLTPKGVLTDEDISNIVNHDDNQVVQVESLTKNDDITKIIVPLPTIPIDPAVYDTKSISDDIMYAAGTQDANLGPARPNVTATVGSIAEQSRMSLASSNVDDLDDFLTWIAQSSGEMMIREMSENIVTEAVGIGAVWPGPGQQKDYLNTVYLEIQAASSGRPNKALEIQNMERLGPLLLQFGVNPIWAVKEMIRRLDDRLDIEDAFPLTPMQPPQPGQGPPQGAPRPQPPPGQPGQP